METLLSPTEGRKADVVPTREVSQGMRDHDGREGDK